MPRSELPLEGDDPLTAFAADLRVLRQKAGSPPYRQLARAAHYSSSTLADAAGGKRLPTLAVTLAFVRACGRDVAEWEARWHQVAATPSAQQDADAHKDALDEPGGCPYAGLSAFEPQDAAQFYGRERLTEELVARVRARRFVAVFGASGSGKSSLLRAGLLAHLNDGPGAGGSGTAGRGAVAGNGWPVLLFTPGAHPLDACAAQLAALVGGSAAEVHRSLQQDPRALHLIALQLLVDHVAGTDLLVVVDQFEEVFTLCADEERALFVGALLAAVGAVNSRVRVVLGVRADFYARCAQYPELVEALRDAQVLVGPMSTEELRRAISSPAAGAGCTVEGALLARVVADATGQPNALPLVSHALRETWQHRRGNTLTVGGYEAAGGIHYALARTAEATYQALTADQQRVARGILLRLVALGEGTEDTKRPVTREKLDTPQASAVLDALTRARLVTLDARSVELTHEALLSAWPRLRRWIDEDRAGLLTRQQLTDASAAWTRERHDTGALYRGERLAAATAWAASHHDLPLDEPSRQFLVASTRHARRTIRLRRAAIAALCALTLLASGTAITAQRNARQAQAQGAVALSRQLAAESQSVDQTDPILARQLALAAWQVAPTGEAKTAMIALLEEQQRGILVTHSGTLVTAVAFSPNGGLIAVANGTDGCLRGFPQVGSIEAVQIWNPITGLPAGSPINLPHDSSCLGAGVPALEFSHDSKRLFITTGADRSGRPVWIWDIAAHRFTNAPATLPPAISSPATVPEIGTHSLPSGVALSPGNRFLLTFNHGDPQVWDTTTDSTVSPPLHWCHTQAGSSALSPDGNYIASAIQNDSVTICDVATGRVTLITTSEPALSISTAPLLPLEFSPNGRLLAAINGRQALRLWSVATGQPVDQDLWNLPHQIDAFAFSPDGNTLATSGTGRDSATVQLWDVNTGRALGAPLTETLAQAPIDQLAFSPDGTLLAIGGADGTVRLWDLASNKSANTSLAVSNGGTAVNALAYSPDGTLLAEADQDGAERIYNTATGQLKATRPADPTVVSGPTPTTVFALTFSGDQILTGLENDSISLSRWNPAAATSSTLHLPDTSPQKQGLTGPAALSPDGTLLFTSIDLTKPIAGGYDVIGAVLQLRNPQTLQPIGRPIRYKLPVLAVISAGNKLFAVSSTDGSVRLWNPRTSQLVGKPLTDQNAGATVVSTFSSDSRYLATGTLFGALNLWDLETRQHTTLAPANYGVGQNGAEQIKSLAFSQNGTLLASGAQDGTVQLWDTATGQSIGTLANPDSEPVLSLTFSTDGALLAAGKANGAIQQWETALFTNPAQTLCSETQPITDLAWSHYAAGKPEPQGCV